MFHSVRPHILSTLTLGILACGATAALTLLPAAPAATVLAAPATLAAPAVHAQATQTQVRTEITDPDGHLSDSDKQMLRTETERLTLPAQVARVDYVVLGKNKDNFNDSIEEYLRANMPELIADDDDSFANGSLIVAVGMDPHRNGIYCGDDVCSAADLFSGRHLDKSLEAMKPALKKGNTAVGLLDGARYATDRNAAADDKASQKRSDKIALGIGLGLGGAGITALGGGLYAYRRKKRREKISEARADFDYVMKHYADVAQRLPAIDVRANSLQSELADAELRKQWADVRDRFAELDDTVDKFRNVRRDSDDDTFYEHAEEIDQAETTTLQVTRAEENIEKLWQMENGNIGQRRMELADLRDDVIKAHTEVQSSKLTARLADLEQRIGELDRDLSAPDFATQYAQILREYRLLLDLVREEEFSDVPVSEKHRRAPRLYDEDYRIGYGYNSFVPFWMLSTWHANDVEAHAAATDMGSANTSFSSGFSGGGGSSSW
ncbi:DUF5129 domain-containing protein [Corynebacterium ulceribovis]|uniref:DUF5129 domain-containing protein n=1 Tax=Corynebacterium ulceribovis TaxID=487732 RepID=UPI00035C5131|nr:DUF5129 domain-containing protein [Corynebacterium ulceribovis]